MHQYFDVWMDDTTIVIYYVHSVYYNLYHGPRFEFHSIISDVI